MHIGNTYSYLGTPNYRAGSLCSMCMYNLLKTSMCLKVVFMIDMFLSFLHTQMDIFSISDKIESVWTSQHVFDMSILTKTWQEEGFWIWRQKSCQLTYSWEVERRVKPIRDIHIMQVRTKKYEHDGVFQEEQWSGGGLVSSTFFLLYLYTYLLYANIILLGR